MQTKQRYELALSAQGEGRLAAAATAVVLALAAIALASRARTATRVRYPIGFRNDFEGADRRQGCSARLISSSRIV